LGTRQSKFTIRGGENLFITKANSETLMIFPVYQKKMTVKIMFSTTSSKEDSKSIPVLHLNTGSYATARNEILPRNNSNNVIYLETTHPPTLPP
jgi:hypothetical protein